MEQFITACLLIFIGFIFTINSLYIQYDEEKGFIMSTKRLGIIMKYVFSLIFFIGLFLVYDLHNKVIRICYDNNIKIEGYENKFKDFKVQDFKESLK